MFGELVEEMDALTDAQITAELRSLELEHRALLARRAALTTIANSRNVHLDNHRSLKSWLRANLNMSSRSAHLTKAVTELVDCYQPVGDALLDGRLGWDQVVDLARLHTNFRYRDHLPQFIDVLLDSAIRFEYDDFKQCAERFKTGANPDGTHQVLDIAIEHRNAYVGVLGDELVVQAVGGDPVTAEELTQIFQHYVDAEYQTDLAARRDIYGELAHLHNLPRTPQQRRFDALVNLFRAAAGQPTGPHASVANPIVNIVIDADRFEHICNLAGVTGDRAAAEDLLARMSPEQIINSRCETSTGVPVAPRTVIQAALRGHIRRVVTNGQGVVVNMGRKTRLFTGNARTAAQLLATTCSYPGCDQPVEWCDIDHNQSWANGGPTDQNNAQPLCGQHNRLKEDQGFQTVTDIWGKRRTVQPDNTLILPVGMPPPIFPIPPPNPEQIQNQRAKQFTLQTGFTTEIFKITRGQSISPAPDRR